MAHVHALTGREHPVSLSADGRDYLCTACGDVLPEGVLVHTAADPKTGKCLGTRAETPNGEVLHDCAKTKIPGSKATNAERVALRGGIVDRANLPEKHVADAAGVDPTQVHGVAHEAFLAETLKKHKVESVDHFLSLTQV